MTLRAGFVVLMAVALGALACGEAFAGAPQVRAQAPGFFRMMVGSAEVTALLDGTHTFPVPTALQAPPGTTDAGTRRRLLEDVAPGEAAARLGDEKLALPFEGSINAFLINLDGRLTLIDTGAGELYGACCGHLVENLRASGYRPEEIDDILLTHLHADHVGGLTAGGSRVFPNATVHVAKADLAYWLDPAREAEAPAFLHVMFDDARTVLKPYLDTHRIQAFEGDGEIVPGIRALASSGHTPGHTSYLLKSGDEKLLAWGDVVHVAPIQLAAPGVTVTYDSDPGAAESTRERLLAEAAADTIWIAAAHISFPGLGHIGRRDGRFVWFPANYTTRFAPLP